MRIALNQSRFREANENIEATAVNMGVNAPVPFLCECADESCTKIISLFLDNYEEIRSHPRRFFNAPGHEALSVASGAAKVIEQRPAYVLVDKINRAGEVAEKTHQQANG